MIHAAVPFGYRQVSSRFGSSGVPLLAATIAATSHGCSRRRHELEASSPGSPASQHPRSGIGAAEPEIPELGYVSLLAGRSRCRLAKARCRAVAPVAAGRVAGWLGFAAAPRRGWRTAALTGVAAADAIHGGLLATAAER
jgi:hypothetical protein